MKKSEKYFNTQYVCKTNGVFIFLIDDRKMHFSFLLIPDMFIHLSYNKPLMISYIVIIRLYIMLTLQK